MNETASEWSGENRRLLTICKTPIMPILVSSVFCCWNYSSKLDIGLYRDRLFRPNYRHDLHRLKINRLQLSFYTIILIIVVADYVAPLNIDSSKAPPTSQHYITIKTRLH